MFCECVHEFGAPLVGESRPDPVPTGTEVLVKVTAAGLCHSDLHISGGSYDLGHGRKLHFKDRGMELPRVLGHEVAGRIAAVGPQAGDPDRSRNYVIYPWQGCGGCARCLKGMENLCLTPRNLGFHRDGGFASHIMVAHPRYMFDIGDLPPEVAAPLACSGLTAFSALQKVRATLDEAPVVIVGAGGLGLTCIGLVRALGGQAPIVIDIDPVKRRAAEDAGAIAVDGGAADLASAVRAAAGGTEILAVIDFVNTEKTARADFDIVTKGGTIVLVGLYGGAAPWSLPLIPIKGVSILGCQTGSLSEFAELISMARDGRVKLPPATPHPLRAINQVMTDLHEGRVIGRAVLVP